MKNIVLIGFKQCGKSTVGSLLAKRLKKTFIDTDCFVEDIYLQTYLEKKSSFAIYRDHGEKWFRKLEQEAIAHLKEKKETVIATGGGSLLIRENARLLKKNGFFVFLDAPKILLKKRVKVCSSFVNEENFDLLFEERRKLYLEWADVCIATKKKTKEEIVQEMIERLYGKQ